MATYTSVVIDLPEAQLLADLTGIQMDFESAIRFAEKLRDILNEGELHSFREPMTVAILIRYSRPFAKGRRRWLGEKDLEMLSPEQRRAHDRLKDWRDKHIAHSVNVFEDIRVAVSYCVERIDEEGFTSVGSKASILAGLSSEDIEWVIELASHFLSQLEPCIQVEKQKVLSIVRSMPTEKILERKNETVGIPSVNDAGKVRRQ